MTEANEALQRERMVELSAEVERIKNQMFPTEATLHRIWEIYSRHKKGHGELHEKLQTELDPTALYFTDQIGEKIVELLTFMKKYMDEQSVKLKEKQRIFQAPDPNATNLFSSTALPGDIASGFSPSNVTIRPQSMWSARNLQPVFGEQATFVNPLYNVSLPVGMFNASNVNPSFPGRSNRSSSADAKPPSLTVPAMPNIEREENPFQANSPIVREAHQQNDPQLSSLIISLVNDKIKIDKFTGSRREFPTWKRLYEQRIHNNPTLSNEEKYDRLLKALPQGSPLIQNLNSRPEFYEVAYGMVCDAYSNVASAFEYEINRLQNANKCDLTSKGLYQAYDNALTSYLNMKDIGESILKGYGIVPTEEKVHQVLFNAMIATMVERTLPNEIRLLLKRKSPNPLYPTELSQVLEVLKDQSRVYESIHPSQTANHVRETGKPKMNPYHRAYATSVNSGPATSSRCLLCRLGNRVSSEHVIWQCEQFQALGKEEKKRLFFSNKFCINCGLHNYDRERPCRKESQCEAKGCALLHHSLFHLEKNKEYEVRKDFKNKVNYQPRKRAMSKGKPQRHHVKYCNPTDKYPTKVKFTHSAEIASLSPSVTIQISTHLGSGRGICHAILDTGATANFISQSLVNELNLKTIKTMATAEAIDGTEIEIDKKVCFTYTSLDKTFEIRTEAYVLYEVSSRLSPIKLPLSAKDLQLSNIEIENGFLPQILLGAGEFDIVFDRRERRITKNLSVYSTKLGRVLIGKPPATTRQCFSINLLEENKKLSFRKIFGDFEELNFKDDHLSDAQIAKVHFQNNTEHNGERYVVKIPWKPSAELGRSHDLALTRLKSCHKKFKRDAASKNAHVQQINELIASGFIIPTRREDLKYFVPHLIVSKSTSLTTKHRLVMDFSMKTSNGLSLNDIQYPGERVQENIDVIVARMRVHPIAVFADLTKMYNMICLHDEDQRYHGLIWAENENEPLKYYKCTRLSFGATASSYLAIMTLMKTADDNPQYPIAAEIIRNNFYCDDLCVGFDSEAQAIESLRELQCILKIAGFRLRKYASNCPAVLVDIPKEDLLEDMAQSIEEKDHEFKTLGLMYDYKQDQFKFSVENVKISGKTKRAYCSYSHSLFDSQNFLGPLQLYMRKLMQEVFSINTIDWDDELPKELLDRWDTLAKELPLLESLRIKRHVSLVETSEIHIFCDASGYGIGSCLYVANRENEKLILNLLLSQVNVVPNKSNSTIPRNELNSLVLGAKLAQKFKKITKLVLPIYIHGDNTCVIAQAQKAPALSSTYVANRVRFIQENLDVSKLVYINTKNNICADNLSRALSPAEFMEEYFLDCWFYGPPVCRQTGWVPISKNFETKLEEKAKIQVKMMVLIEKRPLERMIEGSRSLNCLLGAIARIIRWMNNSKSEIARESAARKKNNDPFSAEDLTDALHRVVRYIQQTEFPNEMEDMKKGVQIRKGPLAALAPYLDDGVIRCYGRLSNSKALPNNTKFPIILPRLGSLAVGIKSFTQLVLDDAHHETLHGGIAVMRQHVRKSYWLIHATKGCSSIRRACVTCKRYSAHVQQQLMGNLIPEVLTEHRPFDIISIDYAGPFLIYINKRKNALGKAYALVIKCLISKGVVLELVGDMTAEAHLAAMRRAFSYMSTPLMIISDRGSNFIKGNKQMAEDLKLTIMKGDRKTQEYCANKDIKFKLLPPQASSTGGQHEVEVKIMKMHLKKVLGKRNLTFEQLQNVLKQVQVVMNQRPLSALCDEPGNFEVITPFSAYTGKNLNTLIEPDQTFLLDKNHYRALQNYVQQVQRGIINDVSRLSMTRAKWQVKTNPVKKNQMVLVRDNRVTPAYWKLARVKRLLSDKSGTTRLVELIRPVYDNEKYPKGPNSAIRKRVETRHVNQLAPLPVDADEIEEVKIADYRIEKDQIESNLLMPDDRLENDSIDSVSLKLDKSKHCPVEVLEPLRDEVPIHIEQEKENEEKSIEIMHELGKDCEKIIEKSQNKKVTKNQEKKLAQPAKTQPEAPELRRSNRVRKPPMWLTLMCMMCVLPMIKGAQERMSSNSDNFVRDVSPGIFLTHMSSAELKAGEAILVIKTGTNLDKDQEEINHVITAFQRICIKMDANYRLNASAPNCWPRYDLLRHAAQRTKCIIESFYHLDKQNRTKRFATNDLEALILKLPPKAEIMNIKPIEPVSVTERSGSEKPVTDKPDQEKPSRKKKDFVNGSAQAVEEERIRHAYSPVTCPYNPPLSRPKRKGVLNWLWGFLFAGDEKNDMDQNELRFHEYQTNVQLSAVKHSINQNAVNAELFRSAHNQLMIGLDQVAKNQVAYNHNEMSAMLLGQTLNVMQTLEDLQLQYVEWDNQASLLMGMEHARKEFEQSLPTRFTLSKATGEQQLKIADKWTEVVNNTIIIKVKIPIVFKKAFQVLKVTPIPDINSQKILNIPHEMIAINEADMEFMYINSDTKTLRLNDDLILLDETVLKIQAPNDCISAAILRSDLKPNCTLKSLPKVYNQWERLNLNTYLFYTNEMSGGWMKCLNGQTKIRKRIGIVKIPSDCSVTSYDLTIVGRLGIPAFSNFFLIPHEELNIDPKMEVISDVQLNLTTMAPLIIDAPPVDMPINEKGWFITMASYLWQIIGAIIGIVLLVTLAIVTTLFCQRRRQKLRFANSGIPSFSPKVRFRKGTSESNVQFVVAPMQGKGESGRDPVIFLKKASGKGHSNEGTSGERILLRNIILNPRETLETLNQERRVSVDSEINPFADVSPAQV